MSTPPTTEINPQSPHAHTHTIIFLHGRGDTASNFTQSLPFSRTSTNNTLPSALPPTIRWVFPSATPHPAITQRNQRVSQWFDVADVRDFSVQEDLQLEGLRPSVDRIRGIVADEVAQLGGQADRVVLIGISQGAAVSVHTLVNLELGGGRLGAFVGFSCRMPFPGRALVETRRKLGLGSVPVSNEVIHGTPVLLEHCVDDPLVLIEHGRALRRTLEGFGAQVTWKEYPDGGHWFNSPNGMDDVVEFLNEHVFNRGNAEQDEITSKEIATSSSAMDLD